MQPAGQSNRHCWTRRPHCRLRCCTVPGPYTSWTWPSSTVRCRRSQQRTEPIICARKIQISFWVMRRERRGEPLELGEGGRGVVGISSVTYDVAGVVGAAVSLVVFSLLAQCALLVRCGHEARQQAGQEDGSDGGKLLDLHGCDWYCSWEMVWFLEMVL